ncbi:MAG: hypothetical protein V4501_10740 [Pseudomonadota bacterium]
MTATNSRSQALIFIFPYALTQWDAIKFGLPALQQSEVNLRVLDLSALICTRSSHNVPLLQESYITKIHSYDELAAELAANARQAIYVDNINGMNGFQWQGRKIFKLFKKFKVNYWVVEVGSLPILANGNNSVIKKLKKLLHFKKAYTFAKWKIGKILVYYQWKLLKQYQLPVKIFTSDSELLKHYIAKYQFDPAKVILIHSFDHDRYLTYLRENPASTNTSSEKTCVFLDQMLATHSDFGKNVSFSPVTAAKYIPSLNRFFDMIESKLGLKIIIAASPRANYEATPGIFGNRTIIKDKTLELVANSSLVLMHSTTAVSFPVLFDKPIMLLKTAEMVNAPGYANFLDNMARSLGLSPVLIDDEKALANLDFNNYHQWPRNYDNYKYKYVMSKQVQASTIPEFMIKEFNHAQ